VTASCASVDDRIESPGRAGTSSTKQKRPSHHSRPLRHRKPLPRGSTMQACDHSAQRASADNKCHTVLVGDLANPRPLLPGASEPSDDPPATWYPGGSDRLRRDVETQHAIRSRTREAVLSGILWERWDRWRRSYGRVPRARARGRAPRRVGGRVAGRARRAPDEPPAPGASRARSRRRTS
jgi:hypothetical protein